MEFPSLPICNGTEVNQTRAREIPNSRKTDCIKQKVIYYGSSHAVNNVNKYKKKYTIVNSYIQLETKY